MPFAPSPVRHAGLRTAPNDPRFLELQTRDAASATWLLCGVPFDGAVIGRKGSSGGPAAIRDAMRWLGSWDPAGTDLSDVWWHDLGDVSAIPTKSVRLAHAAVRRSLAPVFKRAKPVVIVGGDNSLSFPHIQALCDSVKGRVGLIVVDAHYDLRPIPENGQPTSGTPYRRVIEELGRRVRPANIVEMGIRPFANSKALADYAAKKGVTVMTAADLRSTGIEQATDAALDIAGDGVEHIFLSFDADALDQSIAPGVSAPGAGGLYFEQAAHIVETVAADARCRGMDLVEVAPNLDPSGNTVRAAAQLVAHFAGGIARRSAKPA